MFLKSFAMTAMSLVIFAGPAALPVDCEGCAAEGSSGLAAPALPNNPNAPGAGNGANQADSDGRLQVADIGAPTSASGSWKMTKSGNGKRFESTPGSCKENPDAADSDASDGEEAPPPCIQEASCTWKLADTSATGPSTLTITITSKLPSGGQTTGPSPSANFTQTPGSQPPAWTTTFSSNDAPMSPGCNGEIEFVVCWNEAGTPQRWELSFRCEACREATADGDDGTGE